MKDGRKTQTFEYAFTSDQKEFACAFGAEAAQAEYGLRKAEYDQSLQEVRDRQKRLEAGVQQEEGLKKWKGLMAEASVWDTYAEKKKALDLQEATLSELLSQLEEVKAACQAGQAQVEVFRVEYDRATSERKAIEAQRMKDQLEGGQWQERVRQGLEQYATMQKEEKEWGELAVKSQTEACRWRSLIVQDEATWWSHWLAQPLDLIKHKKGEAGSDSVRCRTECQMVLQQHNGHVYLESEGLMPTGDLFFKEEKWDQAQEWLACALRAEAWCVGQQKEELEEELRKAHVNQEALFALEVCQKALNQHKDVDDQIKALNTIFAQVCMKGVYYKIIRKVSAAYKDRLGLMESLSHKARTNMNAPIQWDEGLAKEKQLLHDLQDLVMQEELTDQLQMKLKAKLCPIKGSTFDIVACSQETGEVRYSLIYEEKKSTGEKESALMILQSVVAAKQSGCMNSRGQLKPKGFRTIFLDEAFDHLSIELTQQTLEFMEKVLNMQVIAIMPSSKINTCQGLFASHHAVIPQTKKMGKSDLFTSHVHRYEIDCVSHQDLQDRYHQQALKEQAMKWMQTIEPQNWDAVLEEMPDSAIRVEERVLSEWVKERQPKSVSGEAMHIAVSTGGEGV